MIRIVPEASIKNRSEPDSGNVDPAFFSASGNRPANVQSVLTVRTFFTDGAFRWGLLLVLVFLGTAGCRSVPPSPDNGNGTEGTEIPPAYPFLIPGLRSPLEALAREDGEEIYRIALENDRLLRQEFAREETLRSVCACDSKACRRARLNRFEELLKKRELAWRRQLTLRLNAMETAVQSHITSKKARGPDFVRYRLLIETLSEERMTLLRRELVRAGESCAVPQPGSAPWFFQAPPGAFFLPYYTAWFRFSRDLPPALRKEFFSPGRELPKL